MKNLRLVVTELITCVAHLMSSVSVVSKVGCVRKMLGFMFYPKNKKLRGLWCFVFFSPPCNIRIDTVTITWCVCPMVLCHVGDTGVLRADLVLHRVEGSQ